MAGVHSDAANAPGAFRARTRRFARQVEHYDFDLGGTLFGDTGARLVDCGDVPGDPRDLEGNKRRATDAVRALLDRGATPLVLGGDDSVPPLVVRAFERHGPVNVLQIDAHLDFRDEVHGIRDGYSSPMRRIRELPWVGRIVQVGMRGVGSARPSDVDDARRAGNVIVTAAEVHEHGIDATTPHLVDDAPWFVTIDVDGLDPTIAPATSVPLPGGLTYTEAAGILCALAWRCRFAGLDIVEHFPSLDVRDVTSVTLGRLVMNVLGLAARRAAAPGKEGKS
ncbi:MAG: amidohydrolase [Micromonosporaceae bacterium]|nr:amidohydrolase [Micromonosporaceae bacterium]